MQGHVLLKQSQHVSNPHLSNLSLHAWWDWLFLHTLQNIYVLIWAVFPPMLSNWGYLKWRDTLYSHTAGRAHLHFVKEVTLHCNNSSLRKSKATFCLLTPKPFAELSHSCDFPDSQRPHASPCENINKHCFYYCGKFQDATRPPSSSHPRLAERWPPGSQGSAVVSQAWVTGCWRIMPQGCGWK